MPQSIKRKHHYIPAFYLRNFADSRGSIWVYDKLDQASLNPRPVNSKSNSTLDAGFKKDYHSFENSRGCNDTNTIEDYLEHYWETPAAKMIAEINNGIFPYADKEFIAYFIGLMFSRVPNYKENFNAVISESMKENAKLHASNKEIFLETLKGYEKHTGKKLTDNPDEFRDFIFQGKFELIPRNELYLNVFFRHGWILGSVISKMRWRFYRSTDRFQYLSSDNPVFFAPGPEGVHPFYGYGLLTPGVEVTFPFSSTVALVASHEPPGGDGIYSGNHEIVKTINRRTVLSAKQYIYAPENSQKIVGMARKYRNSRPTVTIKK
jgi:hypothetical protein